MNTPLPPPSDHQQALHEARTWLRLLNSGQATTWDGEGFQQWLQNAVHREAFQQAKAEWDLLNQAAQQRAQQVSAEQIHATTRHMRHRRRLLQAGTLGLGLTAGITVLYPPAELWPDPQQWGADARTRTGEQQQLTWQNATLNLNTRTSIQELKQQAGFRLLQGEAAIQINTKHDFEIHAGVARSRTRQGHFECKHLDNHTTLRCLSGELTVYHPYGERVLRTQQQLHYASTHISPVQQHDHRAPAAWRQGELSFEHTPLEQVITEINRYRQGRVVLLNTQVAQEPLSGRFQLHALEQAIIQIQHTFMLNSRHMPAGLIILS
ncbi:FecR family protein [Alcaligenes endophyticus]|uniref:FecR domain-containing protein n=1 Tax=Alcaligenes endophyticus TaxID=1929088 RepID=A0ABT8EKW1_9BURK|nr:FecR domain-containing protein [Alcaligenes endophyticus]MCX5590709.1 FecR domain-containing protein [Alcaligenes endophyticus]MDN4121927.1 FecR domain-containing protein [Alcaligenes endophyticus]